MGRTSATTAEVMENVESARASRGLSKAELARRSFVRPETVRHLLTGKDVNPTLSNVLGLLRPLGLGLKLTPLPSLPSDPDDDRLKGQLAHYGAALYGPEPDPGTVPPPETVLADGLRLARKNASVARTLPLALWKTRDKLDLDLLLKEGRRRGQDRTLGFFLCLTSQLSGDPSFREESRKLKVLLPSSPTQFFQPTTMRERNLAEVRTPEVARDWGFRMNMGMDSFESMFAKGTR